jgi:dihydroorotase
MSFPDVIRAATVRPAEVLGLQQEVGTLRPGALADVALFNLEQGRFPLYDIHMNMREGTQLIRNTLTIANGRPLARLPGDAPAPWIELSESQRALIERGHTPDAFATNVREDGGSKVS